MKELLKPDVQEVADIDPPPNDHEVATSLINNMLAIKDLMEDFSSDPYVISLLDDLDLKELVETAPEDSRQLYRDEIERRTPKEPPP